MTMTMARSPLFYVNGRMVEAEKACVPVLDPGYLHGDAVFETMRLYHGIPFLFERHIDRLQRSARAAGFREMAGVKTIKDAVDSVITGNSLKSAMVRMSLSREMPGSSHHGTFTVTFRDIPAVEGETRGGVHVIYVQDRSLPVPPMAGGVKSSSYQGNIIARNMALESGAFEAIIVGQDGFIREGTMSNVFFMKGRRIMTPSTDLGILQGITRATVMEVGREFGYAIQEGHYRTGELKNSTAAFLTGSGIELLRIRLGTDDKGEFEKLKKAWESVRDEKLSAARASIARKQS